MKDLFNRNYLAVKNRGLLDNNTSDIDFFNKLKEEIEEVRKQLELKENDENLCLEIADCLNVCSNWLIFKGIGLTEILTKIAEKNEKRAINKK